jgi:GR25 family glycosyltransferase involved in LPS biosynthesis
MHIKKYVINLKKKPDRLYLFLKKSNIQYDDINIVSGFDGSNPNNENIEEQYFFNNYFTDNLNTGEKGCFLSHIRIFKDIIKNNIDFGIIYEDDCNFCDNYDIKINNILKEMPTNTKILYFGGRFTSDFYMADSTFTKISNNIVEHNKISWDQRNHIYHDRTTHGYIVSKAVAEKIVSYFDNKYVLYLPIDHWIICICMDFQIPIYNTYPLLCHCPLISDSNIR